jgi:hypothetical protein
MATVTIASRLLHGLVIRPSSPDFPNPVVLSGTGNLRPLSEGGDNPSNPARMSFTQLDSLIWTNFVAQHQDLQAITAGLIFQV